MRKQRRKVSGSVEFCITEYKLGMLEQGRYLVREKCLLSLEQRHLNARNKSRNVYAYKRYQMRSTMAYLLEYLLENAIDTIVTDAMLMRDVWEANGLRSSAQRLWQVVNSLKHLLESAGIDSFILRISGKGYLLKSESVLPLYTRERVTDVRISEQNEQSSEYGNRATKKSHSVF